MKKFIYIPLFFIIAPLNGQMPRRIRSDNSYSNSSSIVSRFENMYRSSENRTVLYQNQLESIFLQALILSWVMSVQNSDEKTERSNYSRRNCNVKRDY